MIEKFKTLFFVKSSLIFLYLALTIPIPFIVIENLKILSIIAFIFGIFLIINITSDYVETCNEKISYKTSFISQIFGKKSWEIFWKDIKSIKKISTSQGSKVFYFITRKEKNFLIPQRVENLYCVGDSCFPGQGLNAVAFSGYACAHKIGSKLNINDFNLPE